MISKIELDKIAANYAEVHSSEDEFIVSSDIKPEEYLILQSELRDNLFEQCQCVLNFVLQNYDLVPKSK